MRVRGSIGSLVTALIVAGVASYVPGVEAAGSSPSSGGGGMDMGSIRQSPEEMAKAAFRDGAKAVKQADKYAEEAATAPEAKKAKAAEKAQKQYEKAKQKFVLAIQQQPKMHEAWNYLGYTSRKLGFYNDALTAYAEALKLKPGFPEAIEYRGEAYLGLNQLEDAKTAYMALFRDSRPLADQLMAAMQKWVSERRANSAGVAADDIEKFAQWIAERTTIAQQTASLAVDAPRTNWN